MRLALPACWACGGPVTESFLLRGAVVCSPKCVVAAGMAIAPGIAPDERQARPGEACVCGRPAVTAFITTRGVVPYCGVYGSV